MKKDETLPKIVLYDYRAHPDNGFVWVINPSGEEKIYSVDVLKVIAGSKRMPDPLRSMAEGALKYLKVKKNVEKDIHGLTLTTIQGIKVYQDLGGNFMAYISGTIRRSNSLSYLERIITGALREAKGSK